MAAPRAPHHEAALPELDDAVAVAVGAEAQRLLAHARQQALCRADGLHSRVVGAAAVPGSGRQSCMRQHAAQSTAGQRTAHALLTQQLPLA